MGGRYSEIDYDTELYVNQSRVFTTVTNTASAVHNWISDIYRTHRCRLNHLIVGLDAEWRPSSYGYSRGPVATLQLCVGMRCLIFQLLHADFIPESLTIFLANPNFTFVGVGVREDANKLQNDYQLHVARTLDLRPLAAEKLGMMEYKQAGLKRLADVVLGFDMDRSRNITMSEWDAEMLDSDQVLYACMDAHVSFEIGKTLITSY
ncbi:hypothetical protein AAC387_Pa09g0637 [Persea americana]